MLKITKNFFFLCLLSTTTIALHGKSEVQTFIDLAQEYSNQLKLNNAYKSQEKITRLIHLMPTAQEDLEQETRDQKIHLLKQKQDFELQRIIAPEDTKASIQIYESRVTLGNALCNFKDFSPLKTALAQTKAILNPADATLQKAAIEAEASRETAQKELKAAEESLDAEWKANKSKHL